MRYSACKTESTANGQETAGDYKQSGIPFNWWILNNSEFELHSYTRGRSYTILILSTDWMLNDPEMMEFSLVVNYYLMRFSSQVNRGDLPVQPSAIFLGCLWLTPLSFWNLMGSGYTSGVPRAGDAVHPRHRLRKAFKKNPQSQCPVKYLSLHLAAAGVGKFEYSKKNIVVSAKLLFLQDWSKLT